VGYWAKFPAALTQNVFGEGLALDSVNVLAGWNMIGSLSVAVDSASIVAVPSGIVASQYFGYNGGYTASATIEPGKAYWVKVNAPGKLVLIPVLAKKSRPSADDGKGSNR
jgi:hypothetical protein